MTARTLTAIALACWLVALLACRQKSAAEAADPLRNAFDSVADASDPTKIVPLTYQQAQGKRVFETYCVWCHADATPAGPSNRSNVTPTPAIISDGAALNVLSDCERTGTAQNNQQLVAHRTPRSVLGFRRTLRDPRPS